MSASPYRVHFGQYAPALSTMPMVTAGCMRPALLSLRRTREASSEVQRVGHSDSASSFVLSGTPSPGCSTIERSPKLYGCSIGLEHYVPAHTDSIAPTGDYPV